MKKLIIDAHNISGGGGLSYLLELLSYFDKVKGGAFDTIEVVVSTGTGKVLPEYTNIALRSPSILDSKVKAFRILWLVYFYVTLIPQRQIVLLSIGGFVFRRHNTVVLMQSILPFLKNLKGLYRKDPVHFVKFTILKYLYLFSAKFAKRIVFPSAIAQNTLIEAIKSIQQKSTVIHHGISKSVFFPSHSSDRSEPKYEQGRRPIRLLYVSGFSQYKKQFELMEDFYRSNLNAQGITLSLVGMVSARDRIRLEQLLEEYKNKGIKYLGHLKFTEMREVYEEHDILVFPSLIESFGIPMVEAAATNMWVIFSNPQFKEIMGINNYQRYSVAEGDFCEKIRKVIDLHRAGSIDLFDRRLNTGFRTFEDTVRETLLYLEEMLQDSK